jgi:hypothetical protein
MSTSTERMRRLRERRAAGLLPIDGEPPRPPDELLVPAVEVTVASLQLGPEDAGAVQLARVYARVIDQARDPANGRSTSARQPGPSSRTGEGNTSGRSSRSHRSIPAMPSDPSARVITSCLGACTVAGRVAAVTIGLPAGLPARASRGSAAAATTTHTHGGAPAGGDTPAGAAFLTGLEPKVRANGWRRNETGSAQHGR